jgi:hypothetical protein
MGQNLLTQLSDLKPKRDKPENKRKSVKITKQNLLGNEVHLIILEVFRA